MKKALLTALLSAALGSLALADGFSLTVNLPILPQFGILGGQFISPYRSYRGTALNYTVSTANNVVVGGSLRPGFSAGNFALSSRVGGVIVTKLNQTDTGYVEGAVHLGSNQYFVPGPFGLDADLGGEVFIAQRAAQNLALYGGAGLTGTLTLVPSLQLGAILNAYAGLKLELTQDLDGYLEGGLVYPFGGSLGYDVTASLYYTVIPGGRIGVYTGFLNQSGVGGAGAFKLGLAGEFTEKPETLGTPGNYLP
ncbi:hypothetical protein [Meiothermus granaticius]|uniref:Uncharacterized protein n=1 Tax=Meiothermus granaticius NBRC 107808 TaxID=1227551 RepID=A0A399FCC9_9DEIN|nr:hypothetical protein [Meiothermus granaticius]RIH93396.1 hypothetical protein Mgrana_00652 [Meiothermus granaticius NBRC 107808]GEM87645.1 hypothetical protein MGR01S_22700 [Meiothermus granaticius NBRC 107808]